MLRIVPLATAALVATAAAAAANDRMMGHGSMMGDGSMMGHGSMMDHGFMMGQGSMMGHGSRGIDFAAIDTDGNGSLSRAELQARATARIAEADTNGDGILDRAEIIAMFPAPPGAMFDVFAANPAERMADRLLAIVGGTEAGQVEVATLADRRVNMLLAVADTDRDAAISEAEAEAIADRGDRGDRWRSHHRRGDDDRGEDRRPERQGSGQDAPERAEPPQE